MYRLTNFIKVEFWFVLDFPSLSTDLEMFDYFHTKLRRKLFVQLCSVSVHSRNTSRFWYHTCGHPPRCLKTMMKQGISLVNGCRAGGWLHPSFKEIRSCYTELPKIFQWVCFPLYPPPPHQPTNYCTWWFTSADHLNLPHPCPYIL